MKNYFDHNSQRMVALDGEHEFNIAWCHSRIRSWKRSYFRANSKMVSEIRLRCQHSANDPQLWKYFIECSRKGKMIHQDRITKEAYEFFENDGKKEQYTGVEFIIVEKFVPF